MTMVATNDASQRVVDIISPTVEDLGFEVVRVNLSGAQRQKLQIMAEPAVDREMTVEDCAKISRAVSAVLDVEDPIRAAYTLEVSSPGIDRPLTRLKDFTRFEGFEAKLETRDLVDGRRKFQGRLGGVEDGDVFLDVDEGHWRIAFEDIAKAKLVLTDEMLAKHKEDNAQ
jgi:ribosome maturation factor RimP